LKKLHSVARSSAVLRVPVVNPPAHAGRKVATMAIRIGTPRWMDKITIRRIEPDDGSPHLYVLGGPVPDGHGCVTAGIQIDPDTGEFIGDLRYSSQFYSRDREGRWVGAKLAPKAHAAILANLHRVIDEVGLDKIERIYVRHG
jgi:hypothetical protein